MPTYSSAQSSLVHPQRDLLNGCTGGNVSVTPGPRGTGAMTDTTICNEGVLTWQLTTRSS
jgi:hypothetical protein